MPLKDLERDFVPTILQKKGNAIANVSESLRLLWNTETSINEIWKSMKAMIVQCEHFVR